MAGRADFLNKVGSRMNAGNKRDEHFARFRGNVQAAFGQIVDFFGGGFCNIRQFADFRRHDGKGFAVFLRARRLNRCVQREQPRLVGDLLDNRNFMGNLFHHDDGFRHDFAAFFCIRGRFFRNLLGFAGVVGILLDVRGHLFHRGGDLLGGGGLLRRALRHGFRAAAQFFAADGDIFRGVFYVRHDVFQLLNHRV